MENSNDSYFERLNKFQEYILKKVKTKENYIQSPLEIEISLLGNCNQRCVHCSNKYTVEKSDKIFDTAYIAPILDLNPISVVLTGGEPLLFPDILYVIRKIKERNVAIRILTNGSLMTDDVLAGLLKNGFSKSDIIQVSFDAADENTYYVQRGVDMFELVCKNVNNAVKRGFNIELHTVVTVNNINSVLDIVYKAEKLGAPFLSGAEYVPFNKAELYLMCSSRQLEEIHKKVLQIASKMNIKYLGGFEGAICSNYSNMHTNYEVKNNYYCKAGKTSCYINFDGTVYPCVYFIGSNSNCGNLENESLEDIWNGRMRMMTNVDEKQICERCLKCACNDKCNFGCIGVSSFWSKKIMVGNDPRCHKIRNVLK